MIAVGWFIVGIAALIGGAELVERGGARLAARLSVPPLVIGLTIVSIGTSTPELAVGVEAALRGSGSLAVGNIAGTNTVNILLILGLSALLKPLALHMQTLRFDLPLMTAAAIALLVMAWDGAFLVPPSGIDFELDLVRIDLPVMTAVSLACVPVFVSGRRVTRVEGALFVGAYVAYLTYLVPTRT